MTKHATHYKIVNADGSPAHGGSGRWPLPADGKPGAILSVEGELIPCQNGLHVCLIQDLWSWAVVDAHLYAVRIVGPDSIRHDEGKEGSKTVCRKARLLRLVGVIASDAHIAARAEYHRIERPAWAEYHRIGQTAWAEYRRIERPAWAEYGRIRLTDGRMAFGVKLLEMLAAQQTEMPT